VITNTQKKGKELIRLTVGGNRLDYSGDVATSTMDITTFKILINSTLSTEDVNYAPCYSYVKVDSSLLN
jgi:hypothetical protein